MLDGGKRKGKHEKLFEKKRKTASCWRDGNQMVYRDGRFTAQVRYNTRQRFGENTPFTACTPATPPRREK